MKKKKIYSFEHYVKFTPTDDHIKLDECMGQLNLYWFGDTQCNHWVDGKVVAKYPEIEAQHPEIKDAHCNIRRGVVYKILVDLYSDGTYKINQI